MSRIRQILDRKPPKNTYNIKNTTIIYSTSSINSINLSLLYCFASAIFGDSMPNWKSIIDNKQILLNCFQVIYPTQSFVAGSFFGELAAKCLFLRRSDYERPAFEKSVMRKFEGNSQLFGSNQILSHLKVFIIINNGLIDDDSTVYIGSHNFTKAAWGTKDFRTCETKGFNYELGLIIPPEKGSKKAKNALMERIGFNVKPNYYDERDNPFFSSDSI